MKNGILIMKLIIAVVLISLLSYIGGLFLPWWSIAVFSFLVILFIPMKSGKAFLAGFIGVFILWAFLAWLIDMQNDSILSKRIAELFYLGGSSFLLILTTSLIGGLIGGFGALTSSYLRNKQ